MNGTSTFWNVMFYFAVVVIVVIAIFPFYYAVLTSFETGTAIFRVNYFPESFDLSNYQAVFGGRNFVRSIFNSVFIASITVIASLFLAVTAAYALARVRFRGRGLLLLTILAVSMFPQIAVLAGLFEMINFLGLFNTPYALILSYTIFTLPFTVWLLTTFMRELPVEIEEAAIVDGATPWIIITQVFMPLLWPAMVTTGLLAFIGAWNEYVYAVTFLNSKDRLTLPVGIQRYFAEFSTDWPGLMAATFLMSVPVVVLFLILQKYFVRALTEGAVKA